MKNSCIAAALLLFAITGFAQTKTAPATHDIKVGTKPATTVNSAIGPERADVLKQIEAKMIKVEGGKFFMGCPDTKDSSECYYWEKPGHQVSLTTFYMAKYAVTQKEWEAVVGTKPWFSKDCPECPVENVSWFDAQVFINTLNQLTGRYYRLPTEAEWEFAAKGGTKAKKYKYAGSNDATIVAWFDANSNKQSQPVGKKLPNDLGLYDMSGNVWQWCADWFDDKYYSKQLKNPCDKTGDNSVENIVDNPTGPANNEDHDFYRACRGGSWWGKMSDCRVSNRDRYPPDGRDDDVGFRLARD